MTTVHPDLSPGRLRDILNSPWKFTFSFYHLTGSKQREAVLFSCLGIVPILGAFASIARSQALGLSRSYAQNKHPS